MNASDKLTHTPFVDVNSLNVLSIPDVPGLYCIKLKEGASLTEKYGKVRDDGIIYIGKGDSLRERLWEEELNHRRPATFFRGIGTVLGYLPPRGSLIGKSNQNNYRFSPEDTEAIKEWMRKSLLVNWVTLEPARMAETEKSLIMQYRPLMNTTNNPFPSRELAAARKRCREYARSK